MTKDLAIYDYIAAAIIIRTYRLKFWSSYLYANVINVGRVLNHHKQFQE